MGHEGLIRATTASSLAWAENSEQAVDRVTAIAIASKHNELGSLMLRVEAMDAHSLRRVILLITRKLNHKYRITRGHAEKIAQSALHECLQPHCSACGGRGELHSDGKTVMTCTHCGGSGLRRYTDTDRHAMVGAAINRQAYDSAMGYVRDSLRAVVSGANSRLTS